MVVLAVALPQLLTSLGATNAEAKRRSHNKFAAKSGQLLLFLDEVRSCLLPATPTPPQPSTLHNHKHNPPPQPQPQS